MNTCHWLIIALSLPGCADRDEAIPPALTELHQRASTGDASAQLELGLHYVTGTGILPDEQAALLWIGKAAAQGGAGWAARPPGRIERRGIAAGVATGATVSPRTVIT